MRGNAQEGDSMLQNLHVKNLALIDESEVDFAGGLNILSGETGAGKSIIIGSINLALGGKVQKEMLRNPEKPALVELIFSVTEKQKQVLKQLDVETEDDEVILSRRITGGRGVSKVNGESVPASKVKEIASVLIDIHGQHEHQSLLSKKKHLEILDSYAKEEIEQPKKELAEAYKDYKKLVSELNDADVDEEERLREVSFLEYEVGEIEEAGLTVGAPFVGRLDDICEDGVGLVGDIVRMYRTYDYKTQVLAASIRNTKHIIECVEVGADVATCPLSAIKGLLNHPLTDSGLKKFLEDYKKVNG